jgi:hypothetical protein
MWTCREKLAQDAWLEAEGRQRALHVAGVTPDVVKAQAARLQDLLDELKDTFTKTCEINAPWHSSRHGPCHMQVRKDLQMQHRGLKQAQAALTPALAADRPPADIDSSMMGSIILRHLHIS